MSICFTALTSEEVATLQRGGFDSHGQVPEREISDGDGVPCRHCLAQVRKGDPYLILAYRPFPVPQPYAETGPIFLHAEPCRRYDDEGGLPEILGGGREFVLRGYDGRDRIVYDRSSIVASDGLRREAEKLLDDPKVSYLHVRARISTCYQCRVDRA